MKTLVSTATAASQKADLVAYLVPKSAHTNILKNLSTASGITTEMLSADFKGDDLQTGFFYPASASFSGKRILIVGMGDKYSLDSLRKAAGVVAMKAREMKL